MEKNRVSNTGIERRKPSLGLAESNLLREKVDRFIDRQIEDWYSQVPGADLLEKKEVHRDYYARHLVETAWRIRLLRVVESKAISDIAKISPEAAQIWARYEMEEMLHDEMFLADLKSLGRPLETAYATEPYLSTKLLAGFFSYLLDHEGPLGVVAYSYLVEYVNVKLDTKKVECLQNSLGADHVKGYAAHTKTDEVEDHPGEVWQVLRYLVRSEQDVEDLYKYLEEHQKILAMYFTELYRQFFN